MILVLGTSKRTRGGITSVINAHKMGPQWNEFNCYWLETHIDKGFFLKFFYFFKSFIKYLLIIHKYKIVHFHLSEPPSAIRKLLFFLVAKFFNKKTIIHFHSFSSKSSFNSSFHYIYNFLFKYCDVLIVLSNFWKIEIEKSFKFHINIKILYNPCSIPNELSKVNKEKFILFAGTLNHRKGFLDLINAFSVISKDFPDWKLVFAGNGDILNGNILVNKLGIKNKVEFLGWISGIKKDQIFKQASIFCLPSYAEGFPMAILDAWSYGLPVVCTTVGGLDDLLVHKKNSLNFIPGDILKLSDNLKLLISDKELMNSLIIESTKFKNNEFNLNNINNKLRNIYLELF